MIYKNHSSRSTALDSSHTTRPIKWFPGWLVVSCLFLLAMLTTWGIYPFIASADGAKRITNAVAMAHGQMPENSILPPMQEFVIYCFYRISGGIASYTFFQVFLFYLALVYLIKGLITSVSWPGSLLLALPILAFPVTLIFPAIITDSSVVFSCMCFLVYIVNHIKQEPHATVKLSAILFILVFILFSYRTNTLILAPFIIYLFYRTSPTLGKRALIIVVAGACAALLFNAQMQRGNYHPENLGMAWEIIGVAHSVNDPAIAAQLEICGDTTTAMARYSPKYLNPIFWDDPPLPAECISGSRNNRAVKKAYLTLLTEHFKPWAILKTKNALFLLGILAPYENIQRGINGIDPFTLGLGGSDTYTARQARALFFSSGDSLWVNRPVLIIGASLFLIFLVRRMQRTEYPGFYRATLISLGYFSGFFINCQAMEFRYFAPVFFMQLIITVCAIYLLIQSFCRRISTVKPSQ